MCFSLPHAGQRTTPEHCAQHFATLGLMTSMSWKLVRPAQVRLLCQNHSQCRDLCLGPKARQALEGKMGKNAADCVKHASDKGTVHKRSDRKPCINM